MQGSIRIDCPTQQNKYLVAFKRHKLQLLLQLLDIDIFIQYFCLFSVYMHTSPARCVLWFQMVHGVPHPHPGVQGVAEKWVGVKGQPIGLYTHPHSLPFDTQGVSEKRVPHGKKVPCSENRKKGGEFGWRRKRQQKAGPMT